MIERLAPDRSRRAGRLAGVLALLVATIAIVGSFHDHGPLDLGRPAISTPSGAGVLLHPDCLACKIAPPQATPSPAVAWIGPELTRDAIPEAPGSVTHDAEPVPLTPPRAPPVLPTA
jgi:hypothetical protein